MIRRVIVVTVLAAASGLFLTPRAGGQGVPCSYTVTVVPNVNCGLFTAPGNPAAINNLGHVLLTGACEEYNRTYLWTGGATLTQLPLPPGALGFTGTDLNDVGQVAGTADMSGMGKRGCIYDMNTGQWTILPPQNPPMGWCEISAINNAGQVCGHRSIDDGGSPVNPRTAFRWSPIEHFVDLGVMNGPSSSATAISEDGSIVGWTGSPTPTISINRAFVWRNGELQVLPPVPDGFTSHAEDVTSSGLVMVTGRIGTTTNSIVRTFVFNASDESWLPMLPLPGDNYTVAGGLTEFNIPVGTSRLVEKTSITDHPVVWVDGQPILVVDRVTLPPNLALGAILDVADDGSLLHTAYLDGTGVVNVVLTAKRRAAGDTDCNELVDIDDLLNVIGSWGPCIACEADLTTDGAVAIDDLIEVIEHWSAKGGAA